MQSNFLTIIYSSFIFICVGCRPMSFQDETDLLTYLKNEENGYLQSKQINGVQYQLMYKPTDLLVSQELNGKKANQATIDSLRSKYDRYRYYNLSMSKNNKELLTNVARDRQQFGSMVNTLSFGMEQYIHLFTEKRDTIALLDYVYPRMYGMSKSTSMLLVYPKEELANSEQINFSIADLGFGTGEVSFNQSTELIIDQPSIHFQ